MNHFEIKIRKIHEPAGLTAIEGLGLTEIGKVLVIGEDLDREGRSVEIVAPGLQGTKDSEAFAVVDVVVTFGGRERLRKIGAWVPLAIGVGL